MNTKTIPLNLEGALELGMRPCDICDVGWASYTKEKTKSCRDNCNYLKRYVEKLQFREGGRR